ncbi:RNA polymerase sigma factor [Pseudopedobacter beijingensis]|uniref:RNA polymerase sigma factor n=1 Tax=Pseudopedobacter beijingensis TaxID=1207056 RepID=A0ABW4I8D3_9SPHI
MISYIKYTDEELTDLLRTGDELAYQELYNRYWDVLLDTAFKRISSIELAEEIVQDIFVNLFIRRESLTIKSSFEGYLKNALKYKVFDVFRSQTTHDKYINEVLKNVNNRSITPEEALQVKELKEKIDRTTQKMPEKCREVFILSRVENLSNKLIAERMGISVSTVEKHISKAMNIIKADFREYHLEVMLLITVLLKK